MEIDTIREVALRAAKEAGAILRQGLEQQRVIEFKGEEIQVLVFRHARLADERFG